jgi:hypothetical protein
MAETSWPFDSQTSTENDWTYLMRHLTAMQGGGVIGVAGGTALQVTADSSSPVNVKLAAGYAIVRGHMYYNSSTLTINLTSAAGSDRIDSIVLKLDPTANTITAIKVDGTAGSGTGPTLTANQTDTGVYYLEIAQVKVSASATTVPPSNVTDTRPFIGTKVGSWTTTTRPTGTTQFPLVLGQIGYNSALSVLEVWNGSAWISVTPNALDASVITSGKLVITRGGTNATAITSGLVRSDGSTLTGAGTVVASEISDPTNITAGKIRAGGSSGGVATTIFVQSATPTANAVGDLWFW